jgi:hypothetical protein
MMLLLMGLFGGILGIFGSNSGPSFEQQWKTFQDLGFTLNEGVELSDVMRWEGGAKAFEQSPYALLYQTLGQIVERDPWTPLTGQAWNFDTEAIEDHGSYVDILENISRLTGGELVFEDLKDYVDIEEGKAWVSFTLRGDLHKWDLKVDDDWVDTRLFEWIQWITAKYEMQGRFTYYDTGGQDFVMGYHTPAQLERIRKATGLDIVWFNAKEPG